MKKTRNRSPRPGGAENEVGYCKPPVGTRFPPGVSGNPSGRPRKVVTPDSEIREVLNSKVTVTIDGKRQKVSVYKAVALTMVANAMKGDRQAARVVMEWGKPNKQISPFDPEFNGGLPVDITLDIGEPNAQKRAAINAEEDDGLID